MTITELMKEDLIFILKMRGECPYELWGYKRPDLKKMVKFATQHEYGMIIERNQRRERSSYINWTNEALQRRLRQLDIRPRNYTKGYMIDILIDRLGEVDDASDVTNAAFVTDVTFNADDASDAAASDDPDYELNESSESDSSGDEAYILSLERKVRHLKIELHEARTMLSANEKQMCSVQAARRWPIIIATAAIMFALYKCQLVSLSFL